MKESEGVWVNPYFLFWGRIFVQRVKNQLLIDHFR